MNSIIIQLLPILLILLPLVVMFPMSIWLHHQRSTRRNPLTCQMLRAPGESITHRIEKINEDVDVYLMATFFFPLVCYAVYTTQLIFADKQTSPLIFIIMGFAGLLFFGFRLIKFIKQRHNEYLGLDCERAVGQELNQLMLEGCRVYHDYFADGFNIDHIVIGKNGVFAIETKGRAKKTTGNNREDAKVVYDGHALRFPSWTETEPIEQAKRQAVWLSDWLTKAVGEKIPVTPALALAGWYVERKQKGIIIFNGKNPSFIPKMQTESSFSPEMIQRIAHQVEQRCRDVVPLAYRKEIRE